MEGSTVYLLLMKDGSEKKITIPSDYKVTFGPLIPGERGTGHGAALRIYESETKQRAVFTGVESFRDLSLKVEEKRVTVKRKMVQIDDEEEAQYAVAEAKFEQWVDADNPPKDTGKQERLDQITFNKKEEEF